MSVTVACKLNPKLSLTRTDDDGSGGVDKITVTQPVASNSVASDVTITATKASKVTLALVASTPQSLDATSLGAVTGLKGDTSFADLKVIDVTNNEAVGSGRNLKVFGAGANGLTGPVNANTDVVVIAPGCRRQFYTRESAGWTVDSTHKLIKLDPGTNPVSVTLALVGD